MNTEIFMIIDGSGSMSSVTMDSVAMASMGGTLMEDIKPSTVKEPTDGGSQGK